MEIRKIAISEINVAVWNPRKDLTEDDPEYKAIQSSIDTFGLVEPLVWNKRSNNLVGGHQRLKILIKKGVKEVEVSVVDLDSESEAALNVALNRVQGAWNQDKLASLLGEMSKIPDFNVELTGFNRSEISEILDAHSAAICDDDIDPIVASISEPITRRGDVVNIGCGHRVMCGDATSKEDLDMLLGEERVALFDIDWPYNVNLYGGAVPRNDTRPKKSRKWDRIYSDNLPQAEYEALMRKVLVNIKEHLKPGAAFYQWQAHRQLGPLYQILTDLDFHVSCLIVWEKESAAISYADYSFQTEQAVYGWLKGDNHYFAGKPGSSNLWSVNRDDRRSYIHPCQKPAILAEKAIRNSSRRNDVVLDVFLGSGSVLVAAEALGRRCFGMDLDAKFIDLAVKRFIAFAPDKVSPEIKAKYGEGRGK